MHDAPAMATLCQATLDTRPPSPPTSPPPLEEDEEDLLEIPPPPPRPSAVAIEKARILYSSGVLKAEIGEVTRASLRDIHYIDSSSGSEFDGEDDEGRGEAETGKLYRGSDYDGRREYTEEEEEEEEGAREGGVEAAGSGGTEEEEEDVVLIHDEEVCAAERRRGMRRRKRRGRTACSNGGSGSSRVPRGTSTPGSSATVGGGEHTAALSRSCCHEGGGTATVVSAAAAQLKGPPSTSSLSPSPSECIMKHKCGSASTSDLGEQTTTTNTTTAATAPHASSMAASDAALLQQQQQQPPPAGSGSAMVTTTTSSSSGSSSSMGGGGGAPLRSALKRAGQKSRGHRVSINEAKNECLEADYVILVHEENEPQLVSIRSFDLSLAPGSGVEQVTLSPPEGYKDCFSHAAVRETLVDDSDTESGSGDGLLDLDTPRPHLPDLVNHRTPSTQLTVENVRHHDQLMQGKESEGNDPKVAKTGILKGGKLWKNGDGKKTKPKVEVEEVEEPRRSVRFSGRDEYSMLENLPLDKIPLDAANSATLAKFMPKLRELGMLLGEPRGDWHVELSPINPEPEGSAGIAGFDHHPPLEEEKQPPPQMDDEQISESMQRYEEMRRRIAAAEGRDNTSVCSDESKSSSDSQSSDSTMTETRIRRLENSDMAHVAGGVMRSNSEVRRAIEHNKLRRSLIRFSDARKKDTNKNERNEKGETTSILEKLRWLTATEDATNGNCDQKDNGDDPDGDGSEGSDAKKEIDPKVLETMAQYRKLAEMFNKTTSLRTTEILVPGDVREWKLKADLFPEQNSTSLDSTTEEIPESHSGSSTPTVYQAIPVVSIAELVSDEDCDKLIYSGGVRYTREGTLPPAEEGDEDQKGDQPAAANAQTSDARKQFLTQMAAHTGVPLINGVASNSRDRSSMASNSDSYTFDDIDEALHDDRSSSVPSSSQSSPRLSGRSDMDATSTTESGYSSNETNGELCPVSTAQLLELPPGGVDVDELAEFVRQDAGRMERLRRRYDANEQEEYGFNRRPSVRGIKPRFGSTTDLLNQMATQLAPPAMAQPGMAGSHMTWPYRDAGDEDAAPQRRRAAANRTVLPALQEDMLYVPTSDLSPQTASSPSTSTATATSLTHTKSPRVVHVYSSTGDLRAPPPPRLQGPRESPPPDLIRPGAPPNPNRPHSHVSASQMPIHGSVQSLVMAPQMPTPNIHEHHHPSCRRPASVHGHLPPDNIINRGVLPPPTIVRPHSTLSHYPPPRVPVHYHPYEEPPMPRSQYEGGHPPLAQRGSYPGTVPPPIQTPHYQPQIIPNDPARYPNPPPYGSHPHTHQLVSPREGVPYPRTSHPQVHSVPQVPSIAPGPVQVHQCGPRHHQPQPRLVGSLTEPSCSSVWSHQLKPPGNVHHQAFPLHTVSSHLSYTTPIVPESGIPTRPTGLSVGPSIGPPIGTALINGTIGKLEGIRDERGVPEGASSSPRGPSDPQYPPPHTSPTRDSNILHRHPPPMNMT
ncbi:serine-rich adhesin for platelets-like isoform X2 [Palaemon carinicauda]|uniref:serine-rich adhesin for platelets-like isoform X2 n=1 Tax=Palaemon carinicauda TaxID=392227 RepID=UPI0035B68881